MRKRTIWLVAGAAVVIVPLALLTTSRGEPLVAVETEAVAYHAIRASVLASGNLVYREQAQLSPEVIAKVVEVLKKEGEQVERGEVVLRLDDQASRAQVAQQEAAVRQQRTTIERQQISLESQLSQLHRKEGLRAKRMLAEQQLEDARYAVELARVDVRNGRESLLQSEALLNQYREVLAKTIIRAPISGTVISADIKVGETAVASQGGAAGSSLMTIADPSSVMGEINVDEADIARLKLGQEVVMHTAALPDTPIRAVVQTIPLSFKRVEGAQGGGAALARSYSVKVKLLEAQTLPLRAGMSCRAEIFVSSSAKSLAVPVQAILSNNDDDGQPAAAEGKGAGSTVDSERYVFVNKDSRALKRVVKVGMADDTRQEVLSGLGAGEQVIIGPYKLLRQLQPGQKIAMAKQQP